MRRRFSIELTSPPSYDIVNRRGARLCDAIGCRKHNRIIAAHGGFFCHKHVEELEVIRCRITHSNLDLLYEQLQASNNDASTRNLIRAKISREIEARESEVRFRKRIEDGHMSRILDLMKFLQVVY